MKNSAVAAAILTTIALCEQCLCFTPRLSSMSSSTSPTSSTLLRGGYDATIGTDPNLPIQFFTLPNHGCPYAARTHMTLLELGLDFDIIEISGRPKPDWYLKINPRGKVPTIRIPACNNEVVYESAICNEFLCDYATNTLKISHTLMPEDPVTRARIRLLNDHCDNTYTKTQFTFLMNKDEAKDDELRQEMEDALEIYEEAIGESGGPYFFGGDITLSDIHIYPFIVRLIVTLKYFKGYVLPQNKFPKLLDWFDACSKCECVKESTPTEEKMIEIYKMFVDADYAFGGLNQNK